MLSTCTLSTKNQKREPVKKNMRVPTSKLLDDTMASEAKPTERRLSAIHASHACAALTGLAFRGTPTSNHLTDQVTLENTTGHHSVWCDDAR